jgi:hypothetical protein
MISQIENNGGVIVTGKNDIAFFSWLALRGTLGLEMKGLSRRGPSARTIAVSRLNAAGVKVTGRPNTAKVFEMVTAHIKTLDPNWIPREERR